MRLQNHILGLVFSIFPLVTLGASPPDSCIGNFCLENPSTEQQFVARYGNGEVRRDDQDSGIRYRCFYNMDTKKWAEFQFSKHASQSSRLEGILLGLTELCGGRYRAKHHLDLQIEKGTVWIGMSESEVIARLGPPSRVETLSPRPKSHLFDIRLGDSALLYETEGSLLFALVYIKEGRVKNYRLQLTE